jgi:signal transduction histidine kinase
MGSTALNITQFGAGNALVLALSSTLTIAVLTLTANALMRRYPAHHALIFILGIGALQLGVIPSALWRNSQMPGSASIGWVVVQVLTGVLVILATSGIGSWWRVRDALVQERGRVLSQEQAHALARSRIVADLARETSKVLHGSVQTRLVACAMSTERAIANNDIRQLKEALVEASRILDQESLQEDPVSSLRQEIDRKVQLWVELCDISVHVDPLLVEADMHLAAQSAIASTVGRVIEEAMSNAIRHGDANAIEIQVNLMPDATIRVVVTDNGTGVASNPPGMGSAFLTQATRGAWSLDPVAGGARLTAYVPTSLTSL